MIGLLSLITVFFIARYIIAYTKNHPEDKDLLSNDNDASSGGFCD